MNNIAAVKKCPHCEEFELEQSTALNTDDEFWLCDACGSFYTPEEIEGPVDVVH